MSGILESTVKSTALFLIKCGALDSMFESMATGLGLAVDKIAVFTRDLQAVYAWRRAKGDPRAGGDFPTFVDLYLTDILTESLADKALPASKLLSGLVRVLVDMSGVKRDAWAGVVKDHESFAKMPQGETALAFAKLLAEAIKEHGGIVRDAVARDFEAARAWQDVSGAK